MFRKDFTKQLAAMQVEVQEIREEAEQIRIRHEKKLQELSAAQLKIQELTDLNQKLMAKIGSGKKDIEGLKEQLGVVKAQLTNKEHTLTKANQDHEKIVARLVQPPRQVDILRTNKDFTCRETARYFVLSPIQDWQMTPPLALSKVDFRLRRSDGYVARLADPHIYETSKKDVGLLARLPKKLISKVEILFLGDEVEGAYRLCTPMTAKYVCCGFIVKAEELDAWMMDKDAPKIYRRRPFDGKDSEVEVSVILPFTLPDPEFGYDAQLDSDEFSTEDAEEQYKTQDMEKRCAYLREYIAHYFT